MTRYIAFLRAINVGGHTVKMETLQQLFTELGFANVETFQAAGNVIFDSDAQSPGSLEDLIRDKLSPALGYDVAVFLRSNHELGEIVAYQPFPRELLDTSAAFNVAFQRTDIASDVMQKIMLLKTDIDDFHIHKREIYWLCKNKQSDSTISNVVLEKTSRRESTIRGINTLKKLSAKYPPM